MGELRQNYFSNTYIQVLKLRINKSMYYVEKTRNIRIHGYEMKFLLIQFIKKIILFT